MRLLIKGLSLMVMVTILSIPLILNFTDLEENNYKTQNISVKDKQILFDSLPYFYPSSVEEDINTTNEVQTSDYTLNPEDENNVTSENQEQNFENSRIYIAASVPNAGVNFEKNHGGTGSVDFNKGGNSAAASSAASSAGAASKTTLNTVSVTSVSSSFTSRSSESISDSSGSTSLILIKKPSKVISSKFPSSTGDSSRSVTSLTSTSVSINPIGK